MKKPTQTAGFTLLELLVVIAVMGVATTLALSAFTGMMDLWRTTKSQTDLDFRADSVFALMRADFGQVVAPSLANVPLKGVDKKYADPKEVVAAPQRDDDEATFLALLPTQDGKTGSAQVTYYVDHEGGAGELKRVLSDSAGTFKTSSELAPETGVVWFDLRYMTKDGIWVEAWSEPALPKAVRVSLTLSDPDTGEQVIRKAAFPIGVD